MDKNKQLPGLEVFDRKWLRRQIEKSGGVRRISAAAGMGSPQSLYDHLAGKRSLTADNLHKVLVALQRR